MDTDKIIITGVNTVTGNNVFLKCIDVVLDEFNLSEWLINHNCDISETIKYSFEELDYYEYCIPLWAICYIVNDDASGLEDEEIEKVDNFIKDLPRDDLNFLGTFDWGDIDAEKDFKPRNDIDGNLGGDVVYVRYYL